MGKIIIVVFLTFLACACATIPGATTFVLVGVSIIVLLLILSLVGISFLCFSCYHFIGATGNLAKKYLWQSLLSHVVNVSCIPHSSIVSIFYLSIFSNYSTFHFYSSCI